LRFALPLERSTSRTRKAAQGRSGARSAEASETLAALDGATRARFEKLRTHRAQAAKSRGVPAYVVALDRTLIEMAKRSPRTRAELLEVFGMGPARVEAYGDGFLEVLGAP
jgi:ATP-dependent DNA helicase RecQ